MYIDTRTYEIMVAPTSRSIVLPPSYAEIMATQPDGTVPYKTSARVRSLAHKYVAEVLKPLREKDKEMAGVHRSAKASESDSERRQRRNAAKRRRREFRA